MMQTFNGNGHSSRSELLLARARESVAGGDSSTMRVLPYHPPLVAERGQGCRLWDVDGREYIDLNMAYGPLLFGHCPAFITDAVTAQIRERGSMLGFPHELSFTVAEKIRRLFPSMELLRFANSGTEAVASAVRLAKAFSGRDGLLLFEGNYHGWNDAVFQRYHAALSELPAERFGPARPGTAGMNWRPATWAAEYNCIESVRECLRQNHGQIGAIIVEPVMANAGVIAPAHDFLRQLRAAADEFECVLIFDEVITGLRVAAGGAQARYGVRPDLTVLSKALGGGFPVAAFGGRREIMDLLVQRKVFHGGVYSGNSAVLAAANAVLDRVHAEGAAMYGQLEAAVGQLAEGMSGILGGHGIPHTIPRCGAMMSLFLLHEEVEVPQSYRSVARTADVKGFIELEHCLWKRGVYIHPNLFEPQYVSTAHTEAEIAECLNRFETAVGDFVHARSRRTTPVEQPVG